MQSVIFYCIVLLERIDFFLEGFDRTVYLLHGFQVPPFKERNLGVDSTGPCSLRLQLPYAGVLTGRILCSVQNTLHF